MNRPLTCIATVLVTLSSVPAIAGDSKARGTDPVVVGTFDSRGVLMAYVRSEPFRTYLSAQQADIGHAVQRAQAEGDTELAAALEAVGPAMQQRIHQQGFGTAPIDDIIARIADRLPSIAEESGVDLIVSKWEVDYFGEGVAAIDLTERIAAEFDPSEATLQGIRELVAQPPAVPGDIDERH